MKLKTKSGKVPYIIFAVLFFDQVTKLIAEKYFPIVCNSGIAFGIEGGGIYFSVGILAIVLFMIFQEKDEYNLRALSLVFAGGFSNFIDRVNFGCVRDFINLKFFPVFNFADIMITIGVLFIIYFLIKEKNARG